MNFASILSAVNLDGMTQVLDLEDDQKQTRAGATKGLGEQHGAQAEAALRTGNVSEALRLAEIAVQETPEDARAYNTHAMAFARKGDWESAADDLAAAVAHDPMNAQWVFNRGIAYRNLGQTGEAIRDFEKSLAMQPSPGLAAAAASELAKLRK